MSDTEEINEKKLDSDESAAQPQEAAESAPEKSESKEPSSPAPTEKKAILYGTCKRRNPLSVHHGTQQMLMKMNNRLLMINNILWYTA